MIGNVNREIDVSVFNIRTNKSKNNNRRSSFLYGSKNQ